MKATKALPTEKRVQRMNDQQWLWFYFNLLEDEKEEEKKWKARMDYLTFFINPEMAKSVVGKQNKTEGKSKTNEDNESDADTIIVEGDQVTSNTFEDELRAALGNSNINFTELPDSESVGDPNEDRDDFLSRVTNYIPQIDEDNNGEKEYLINNEDIDFFEYPEE